MDGKDGVKLMQIIQPKKAIPIHYDDYDGSSRRCPILRAR